MMGEAKLEVKAGAVSFCGEGSEIWLAQQLDKVIAKLPDLIRIPGAESAAPPAHVDSADSIGSDSRGAKTGKPLATFLKEKKATSNQARKFLATALWLQVEKSMNRVSTGDVTKALSEHNQGRLSNAAQCLINNASQGNVVRDGKQFYVADEGRSELNK